MDGLGGHYILLYVFSGFHPLSGYIGKPYDEGLFLDQLTLWGIYGCAGWVLVCVCVKCVYITGSGRGGCVADTPGCNNAPVKNGARVGYIYFSGGHTLMICRGAVTV